MTPTNPRPSSPGLDDADPVLAKLVQTATFDCDWPTLRHHLYLALLATVPVFLEKGPPPTYSGAVPITAVSPSQSRTETRSEAGHVLMNPEGEGGGDPSLRPSTHGGLVIPPFPPLDPNRRRPHVMVITASETRMNGTPSAARGNPFEDEWDDEVIIGGRKLPGWMDEEEGKKEVEKIAQRIEELAEPPFTVQRLAELLVAPTKLHSTLGKFLRAVDKTLTVTTAYTRPSYTYVPPPMLPPMEGLSGSPSAASVLSGSSSMDIDSTVPPGSMTPMFSPIPFLPSGGDSDALGEPIMDVEGGTDEGLMSPLMLSDSSGVFASQQSGGRSPTPEPEDEAEMGAGGAGGASGATEGSAREEAAEPASTSNSAAAAMDDPGNQPYLGRVDELDSGPLTTNGHHAPGDEDGECATGVGEAGNMTPHGMSDQPVPITSTTVIGESAREIAPLPRRAESEAGDREDRVDKEEAMEGAEGEATKVEDGVGEDATAGTASTDDKAKGEEEVKGEVKAEAEAEATEAKPEPAGNADDKAGDKPGDDAEPKAEAESKAE